MNDLIKINYDGEQPTVSARDLHTELKIKSNFTTWFERMCEYGFVEEKDFFPKKEESTGGRPALDYDLTIRCGKEICMLQRTEQGKIIRNYLLDLEDAWNTPEQVMARALQFAQKTVDGLKERCNFLGEQIVEQQKVIESLEPKASYYDLVLQCKDLIATTIIAKDYGMSATTFNKILHNMGVQFKQGKTWVLYADYQGNGYTKTKTHNYADDKGEQHTKEHSYWTQKGRLFLYELLKKNGYLPVIEQQQTA